MISAWLLKRLKTKKSPDRTTDTSEIKFNLQKDKDDIRDKEYPVKSLIRSVDIPTSHFLNYWAPPVKNQGSIGSCGSQAYLSAYEILLKKKYPDWFIEGSELYHYFHVRKMMGTFPLDSGQSLREGAKTLKYKGFCPEKLAPYDVNRYNSTPSIFASSFAQYIYKRKFPIKQYSRMWSPDDMINRIAEGYPVVVGLRVYSNLLSYKGGILSTASGKSIGGHAMVCLGYCKRRKIFLLQNSWGTSWGMKEKEYKGYCWISFDYVRRHLIDAWTIDI